MNRRYLFPGACRMIGKMIRMIRMIGRMITMIRMIKMTVGELPPARG